MRQISIRLISFFFILVLPCQANAEDIAIFSVELNSEPVGELFVVLDADDVWVTADDLAQTRLKKGIGKKITYEGDQYISLKSIFGLDYEINHDEVRLKIQADPSLFQAQRHEVAKDKPYDIVYGSAGSAYLNYGVFFSENDSNSSINIASEIGGRYEDWFGSSNFNYVNPSDRHHLVRMLTALRHDDRDTLRTLVLGDHEITTAGVLGGHMILGGFKLTKNFAMDPYYSAAPSFSLSGMLESPSEVEVYINDALVETRRLSPGEFVLDNVPAHIGQGSANVVIKDVYGNSRVISESFYYSDDLLRPGLHEYSYSLGFLREDLGERNFSYGDPVLLGMHNYGLSDALKLGYTAELADKAFNIGPMATWVTNMGALKLDAAVSKSGDTAGYGGSLNYLFQGHNFNASVLLKSVTKNYSTATISPQAIKPSVQFSSVIGWNSGALGSFSVEASRTKKHFSEDVSRFGLSYNKSLSRQVHLFVNGSRSHTEGSQSDYSIFAGLHISFDNGISSDIGYSSTRERETTWESVQNNPRDDDGLGYRIKMQQTDAGDTVTGDFSYRTPSGVYDVSLRDSGDYNASAAGGMGYIDGDFFITRPVLDGFAKVNVGGLEGVRIYRYGRQTAVTDEYGTAIIPEMMSFHDNRISIDQDDIPLDYQYSELSKYINPDYKSGILVDFDVHRFQAVIGSMAQRRDDQDAAIEYGLLQVDFKAGVIESPLSESGEFYLENIGPGRHSGKVYGVGMICGFELVVPESEELLVDVGKVYCEGQK